MNRYFFMLLAVSLLIFPSTHGLGQSGSHSDSDPAGTVTGKILIKGGGPLARGVVLFYDASTGPPPLGGFERVPSFKLELNESGIFRGQLPAGKYYLKAARRTASKDAWTQDGDYVFLSLDSEGKAKEYIIKGGSVLDMGTVGEATVYKRTEPGMETSIEGRVIDTEGKPVEGVNVFAFSDFKSRPAFLSNRTGKDGKFLLKVTEGAFYLKVKNKIKGGRIEAGEFFGVFGGFQSPVPVSVKKGELKKGMDITVIRFPGRTLGPDPGAGSRQ